MDKETLGWISIATTLVSIAPYYYGIWKGKTRPHAFSWLIWSVLGAIAFFAQHAKGAGPGAWGAAAACLACFSITLLCWYKGEHDIVRSDIISLIAALTALPLWWVTHDPLWSIILISAIDVVGYYPTMRKSYHKPHEELVFTHLTGTLKYIFVLLAIEQWSLTTWLYPAVIAIANTALVLMLWVRRWELR